MAVIGKAMESFDLIVVGTGAGGSGVATRCAKAGWHVAGIDDKPYGGHCALRGCDPKKVPVGVAGAGVWNPRTTGQGGGAQDTAAGPATVA